MLRDSETSLKRSLSPRLANMRCLAIFFALFISVPELFALSPENLWNEGTRIDFSDEGFTSRVTTDISSSAARRAQGEAQRDEALLRVTVDGTALRKEFHFRLSGMIDERGAQIRSSEQQWAPLSEGEELSLRSEPFEIFREFAEFRTDEAWEGVEHFTFRSFEGLRGQFSIDQDIIVSGEMLHRNDYENDLLSEDPLGNEAGIFFGPNQHFDLRADASLHFYDMSLRAEYYRDQGKPDSYFYTDSEGFSTQFGFDLQPPTFERPLRAELGYSVIDPESPSLLANSSGLWIFQLSSYF